MDRHQEAISKALRVKELSGLLSEVFDGVERAYADSLFATDVTDQATREAIYHRMHALRDVRGMMQTLINRGAGAQTIVKRLSVVKSAS